MASPTASPSRAFMLLFRNGGVETHQHLSADERSQYAKRWNDWYDALAAQGKVQHGSPLALGGRLVTGPRGQKVIDGPYAEAKDVVAGYFYLTVNDLEEATRIAQQCPGLDHGVDVEVREVVAVSPVLEDVRARPLRT
ncbi:MAG TPA: YciI family protein [Candidatus Synoicihabitans sp.]|nr:YciI family protein [Candidatus Synoicihabitans sp.]